MMTGFNLHGSNSILRSSGCPLGAVLCQMIKHGAAAQTNKLTIKQTNKRTNQFHNGAAQTWRNQWHLYCGQVAWCPGCWHAWWKARGHVIKPALRVMHMLLRSPEKSTRKNDGWQTSGSSITLSHASLSISDLLALQCIILPFSSFILSLLLSPLPDRRMQSPLPHSSSTYSLKLPHHPPLYLIISPAHSSAPHFHNYSWRIIAWTQMKWHLSNGTTAAFPSPLSTAFVHILSIVKHQRFEMNWHWVDWSSGAEEPSRDKNTI